MIISEDERLLMCGKVIIQLNSSLDTIQNIGVMSIKRDLQIINYQFLSLLDENERKIISHKAINNKKLDLVEFDIE